MYTKNVVFSILCLFRTYFMSSSLLIVDGCKSVFAKSIRMNGLVVLHNFDIKKALLCHGASHCGLKRCIRLFFGGFVLRFFTDFR